MKIKVNINSDINYNIEIEKNILNQVGEKVSQIYNGNKVVIVTDKNVEKFYINKVLNSLKEEGFSVNIISIEPGEKNKNIKTLYFIYEKFLEFGVKRDSMIIALGGGVVGDITGLAAATYLRGINFISIPTTLLSQVDSSVGGKTAIDMEEGKNLIGAFYHPKKVIIDTNTLQTLPKKFLIDGMGEVIKYCAIKDEELYKNLEEKKWNIMENYPQVVGRCVDIKREIVEKDPKENGIRMLLNFGHTYAHAIEKYFNYEKYSHGEAVAIGMCKITKNSENLGFTKIGTYEKIKRLIESFNLPTTVDNVDKSKIMNIITSDKKSNYSGIKVVLLKDIGKAFIYEAKYDELEEFFK